MLNRLFRHGPFLIAQITRDSHDPSAFNVNFTPENKINYWSSKVKICEINFTFAHS